MPRKPKSVTPAAAPVDEDLDEFLEDVVASKAPASSSLPDLTAALTPISDDLRATISQIALIDVAKATPAQRTQLVNLRDRLDTTRRDLSTWVDAIDISIRQAAITLGADEIPLADGVITVERPRGEWVVNVPRLQEELRELVAAGVVTAEEAADVVTTKVETVADNRKLNYLVKHRGAAVTEAVSRTRVWKEGNPTSAKLRFARRADA